MKILVLNAGSSSLKFQLIETTPELVAAHRDRRLAHGAITRIGSSDSTISLEVAGGQKVQGKRAIATPEDATSIAFEYLIREGLCRLEDIQGVGHRVVHGAEHFTQSVIIDDEVIRLIESTTELAPLHNPHNLKGYYAAKALLPNAIHVAVFDTAFHHTLPPRAYVYGIPYDYYTRDKIRRYGFHGTSHRYVSYRFAQIHGKTRDQFKLITCHLGNGCSLCAIDRGKSIDTSMGFTPMEGLLMGTRPGDLDPGALLHMAQRTELPALEDMLNERSGLAGISGVSNDMQDLQAAAAKGNSRAALAVEIFCYRVAKYIGAYLAVLRGADAVIFAGGIGENAVAIREQICAPLDVFGIRLDRARNAAAIGKEREIGAEGSSPQAWVIPTDEELLIARDTMRAILGIPQP